MYQCEQCQRGFKSSQALAGHNQFKHQAKRPAARAAGAAAEQLTRAQLEQLAAAQASNAEQQDEQLSMLVEQLNEQLSMLGEQQNEALSMLNELLSSAAQRKAEHAHGDGCPECLAFGAEQQKVGQVRGMQLAASHYEEIPGVSKLREDKWIGEQKITIVG